MGVSESIDEIKLKKVTEINKSSISPSRISASRISSNSRVSGISRRSPPVKKPIYNIKIAQPIKPKRKIEDKDLSPFLKNSFDNLEDDDVVDISARNKRSVNFSIPPQQKEGFLFD